MAIEFYKECPDALHEFMPIVEGTQTVGITCLNCGKTVREDMEFSAIVVTESEIQNLDETIIPGCFGERKRKDPRF